MQINARRRSCQHIAVRRLRFCQNVICLLFQTCRRNHRFAVCFCFQYFFFGRTVCKCMSVNGYKLKFRTCQRFGCIRFIFLDNGQFDRFILHPDNHAVSISADNSGRIGSSRICYGCHAVFIHRKCEILCQFVARRRCHFMHPVRMTCDEHTAQAIFI